MTLHDLAALVYAHRDQIILGALGLLGWSSNPPAWAIWVRRIFAGLRKVPCPKPETPEVAPTTKGNPMSNFLEREWHRLVEAIGLEHGLTPEVVAKLKDGASVVVAPFRPLIDAGVQSLASEASALVVAKYPGVIGQAFGQAIQTTVTAEGTALEGSLLTPAP
jgi:hypothetical protein